MEDRSQINRKVGLKPWIKFLLHLLHLFSNSWTLLMFVMNLRYNDEDDVFFLQMELTCFLGLQWISGYSMRRCISRFLVLNEGGCLFNLVLNTILLLDHPLDWCVAFDELWKGIWWMHLNWNNTYQHVWILTDYHRDIGN